MQSIREYSVLIDSKDRNYQIYPDPFKYTVTIDPSPTTKSNGSGRKTIMEDPNPVIMESFRNVKYIKLEKIILPKFNRIYYNTLMEKHQVLVEKPLTDNNYLVMNIGSNFSDENSRSTNDILSRSFSTIYYDQDINLTHYSGDISNGYRVFDPQPLSRIDKFDINFTDPYGKPLICDHMDSNILSGMECFCSNPEGDEFTECFKHNLFHPLNPLFQHHIHLKIGVVEVHF